MLTLQSFGTKGNSLRRPDAVVVAGTCGSLSRTINEGDVILYSGCLSTSKTDRLNCTASLAKHLKSRLGARGFLCRSALGISSPRVATSKAEKLSSWQNLALSGGMESHEIVAAASQAGLPVVVIRVVSDSLIANSDFNVILRENGEIDPINLLKLGIRSPILTTTVLAAIHRAVGKLRSALAIVLSDETFSKVPVEVTHLPHLSDLEEQFHTELNLPWNKSCGLPLLSKGVVNFANGLLKRLNAPC
jgi:hypothetical protein